MNQKFFQVKILRLIDESGPKAYAELCGQLNANHTSGVAQALQQLQKKEFVVRAQKRQYYLTGKAKALRALANKMSEQIIKAVNEYCGLQMEVTEIRVNQIMQLVMDLFTDEVYKNHTTFNAYLEDQLRLKQQTIQVS